MESNQCKSLKIKITVSIDNPTNLEFSSISKSLTNIITKSEKKKHGIFFTPPETVINMITKVKSLKNSIESILEPSCGSGEFINYLTKYFTDSKINGIELNKTIFESIKNKQSSNVVLLNEDFIKYTDQNKYDLIIGNPPFYVMKKNDAPNNYHEYFDGRPNIFLLFVIKSLKMLKSDGILSFVLPRNFINCLYYDKTRQFIDQNFKIHFIEDCDDEYIDTKQDTIIMIVQKKENPDNNNFTLKVSDYTIFGTVDNITKLKTYYNNYKTLNELNFRVNVGNVVWNQCKSILTDDNSKTRLIYSSDIADIDTVKKYKNGEKKNFIDKGGETGPLLVMNRGYGVGQYKFEYCLLDISSEYLIENHLICIRYKDGIDDTELVKKYKKIMKSLSNKKTQEFIKTYFGNNAINTTEINYILPIFNN